MFHTQNADIEPLSPMAARQRPRLKKGTVPFSGYVELAGGYALAGQADAVGDLGE